MAAENELDRVHRVKELDGQPIPGRTTGTRSSLTAELNGGELSAGT